MLSTVQQWPSVIHAAALDRDKLVTLIAGSNKRHRLFAGDDDEVFTTRSLNIMQKTTE